jgi:hypothetical protein
MLKEMLTGKTGFMFSASHGSPTNFAGPSGYVQARNYGILSCTRVGHI